LPPIRRWCNPIRAFSPLQILAPEPRRDLRQSVYTFAMRWAQVPLERVSDFRPSFCPHRGCREHLRSKPGYRAHRHGFYATSSGKRVRRFLCLTCGHTFSQQTFSTSYYMKRPGLLRGIAAALVAGSANRQIARTLGCAPSTVSRLLARLGRHATLLHARALRALRGRLDEPVVLDHFETFEFSQDYPFGVATAIGARSWFVYALDPAPHRRSGRVSQAQRRRLQQRPRRPAHGGYAHSTRRAIDTVLSLVPSGGRVELRGDGHTAYDRAVRSHPQKERFSLLRYPNPRRGSKGSPRSPEARRRDAAMFPVDLMHKIMRHSLAHHRRETIAFVRRLNAGMERLALAAVWRNFVKRRSERKAGSQTPAMMVGLASRRWRWEAVLSRRLFFDREDLPAPWPELYRREWATPLLPSNARHALVRGF